MTTLKTYTNGNRQIEISQRDSTFQVCSNVFDGVKWQSGRSKPYKTFSNAEKAAAKQVADDPAVKVLRNFVLRETGAQLLFVHCILQPI